MAMPDSVKRRVKEKKFEHLTPHGIKNDPRKKPNSKDGGYQGKTFNPEDKLALHRKNPDLYVNKDKKRKEDEQEDNEEESEKKEEHAVRESGKAAEQAAKFIIENHGSPVDDVAQRHGNVPLLNEIANKLLATCMSGWQVDKGIGALVSENTDLKLSTDSWTLEEDGSASLIHGPKFDYDWLYELATYNQKPLTEAMTLNGGGQGYVDPEVFGDALSNAADLVRKLNDKEVKKYILRAAQHDEDVDIRNLKQVLEDTGINWKFLGAEVDGDTINVFIRVKYSVDGTQSGVVEKKLSIEVKPSAEVRETKDYSGSAEQQALDLSFGD
jgi:hypothetical protein